MHRDVPCPFLTALTVVLLTGCGPDPAKLKEQAQAALDRGDAAAALQQADAALSAAGSDAALAWQVHQIRLQAMARGGDGAGATALLAELAGKYKVQVRSSLFISIASELKKAGQTSAAIDVLDAGAKAFPDEAEKFVAAIRDLQASQELDPAEIEKLKSLGYL